MMQITTKLLGNEETIEVSEDQLFAFDPPLGGFEENRRFALIVDDESPVEWLQSVDDPDVAFALLEAFMRHPNVALDRERLLAMVWGEDFYGDSRTIDVHVAWLRDKLKTGQPSIETVWGVGYKFVPTADAG